MKVLRCFKFLFFGGRGGNSKWFKTFAPCLLTNYTSEISEIVSFLKMQRFHTRHKEPTEQRSHANEQPASLDARSASSWIFSILAWSSEALPVMDTS